MFTCVVGGGCYMVSNQSATFVGCQDDVCGPLNSTLVTITSIDVNEFLGELLQNASTAAFIGLYERGVNESNDWAWVSGNKNRAAAFWAFGEPNNWCRDEDCVLFEPNKGWNDVSCDLSYQCLCEYGQGNATSLDYLMNKPNLTVSTTNWCTKRISHTLGGIQACFWYNDILFRIIYVVLGLPSLITMVYVVGYSLGPAFGKVDFRVVGDETVTASPYGQLLDLPDGSDGYVVLLSKLVEYGAIGEVIYGLALLALGIMSLYHVNGYYFTFAFDAVTAIIMFACKVAVAVSVVAVSRHLSPGARAVAGPWGHLFALSKALMAICALALAVVNFFGFDEHQREAQKLCLPGYIFCWSLLLSLVLQCMSGYAVFRIYERAVSYVDDSKAFAKVIGACLQVLIGCTFGVGIGLGICGALFAFDTPSDNLDPFWCISAAYLIAAALQILSGAAIYASSHRMSLHFGLRGQDNARGVEMRRW